MALHGVHNTFLIYGCNVMSQMHSLPISIWPMHVLDTSYQRGATSKEDLIMLLARPEGVDKEEEQEEKVVFQ